MMDKKLRKIRVFLHFRGLLLFGGLLVYFTQFIDQDQGKFSGKIKQEKRYRKEKNKIQKKNTEKNKIQAEK